MNQKTKSSSNKASVLFRIRYVALSAYYFCVAFVKNRIAEYLDRRLEYKKRYWTAYGTFGSGVVPLGKCTLAQATEKTSKFGTVTFCDVPQAAIFYSEKGYGD